MNRPSLRFFGLVLVVLLLVAACGGDDDDRAADPTSTATTDATRGEADEPTPEPTEDVTPEPNSEPTEDPTPEPTGDPTPEPTVDEGTVTVDLVFEGGAVSVPDDRIDVGAGDTVVINATSDVAEEVHVHGYDLFVDLEPGVLGTISFVADIPGIFEVEFEQSVTFAFELEVR